MYCRRCGAALHQGVVICPECGSRQRRGISSVRCARCNHRVSLGLTVCPHCGRDVHPAGPRWGFWLVGFVVIAFAALWGLDQLPVDQIKTEVAAVRTRASHIVQFLGPVVSANSESTPPAAAAPRATQVVAALPATATLPATRIPATSVPRETLAPLVEVSTPVTTVVAGEVAPTATLAPTLEPAPTLAPTATPTLPPTATPTAAPTATPTPSGRVTYKVQSGDTLSSIASKYGVSWQDLAAANGLTSNSTLRVGQELVIPGKGQAASPATAPAAPATPTKYKVKSGDSLSSIAAQYGITWQELAAANGLTATSRLQVGQELTVPVKGGAVQAVPTAAPSARPTPRPATPTPEAVVLLAAPQLMNPADGSPFSTNKAFIELVWKRVEDIPSDAGYRVTVQWTEAGQPQTYLVPVTTATSMIMPVWLFGHADQPTRSYSWSVRVVRMTTDGKGGEKEILLSPSSETRVLYWN